MSTSTPEFLEFELLPRGPGRKTDTWEVYSAHRGDLLGTIAWYGAWRQYTFLPTRDTRWSAGCMTAVNEFIAARMAQRREART